MNTNNRANYLSGFVPFALAAFLVGIIGGFTTVLGPAFIKNLNLEAKGNKSTGLFAEISGSTISKCLDNSTYFPTIVARMFKIGEDTFELDLKRKRAPKK